LLIGGGGGGGGGAGDPTAGFASGGGGGGTLQATLTVHAGDIFIWTVGNGGGVANSSGGPGDNGGNSSFNSLNSALIAYGGQGGSVSFATIAMGGTGSATGAYSFLISSGQPSNGPAGGGSVMGSGVLPRLAQLSGPHMMGGAFGGGGSGTGNSLSTSNLIGISTEGMNGVVQVTFVVIGS
jgi:glycine rich protein